MIQLPYKSKKKLLIGLTITELVLVAIVIGTAIATNLILHHQLL